MTHAFMLPLYVTFMEPSWQGLSIKPHEWLLYGVILTPHKCLAFWNHQEKYLSLVYFPTCLIEFNKLNQAFNIQCRPKAQQGLTHFVPCCNRSEAAGDYQLILEGSRYFWRPYLEYLFFESPVNSLQFQFSLELQVKQKNPC